MYSASTLDGADAEAAEAPSEEATSSAVGQHSADDALERIGAGRTFTKLTVNVEVLLTWLFKGRLRMNPDYQREFVWPVSKSSELIVTVLSCRVVPDLVLWERKRGTYDVVDGLQRLMSIFGWILNGSEYRDKETRSLVHASLPPDKQSFAEAQIELVRKEGAKQLQMLKGLKDTPSSVFDGYTYDMLCKKNDFLGRFEAYPFNYTFLESDTPLKGTFTYSLALWLAHVLHVLLTYYCRLCLSSQSHVFCIFFFF